MNDLLDKALEQGATVETGMQFLENDWATVNFDLVDKGGDKVLAQAGYISIRKDLEGRQFYITTIDAYGDVVFEVAVPMNFAGFDEEEV